MTRPPPELQTFVVNPDGTVKSRTLDLQDWSSQDGALRYLQRQPAFRRRRPGAELRVALSHRHRENATKTPVCLVFALPVHEVIAFWAHWNHRKRVSYIKWLVPVAGP